MFAIMTNWKTEFQKPLTRPNVKHDEEMSICSSTPPSSQGVYKHRLEDGCTDFSLNTSRNGVAEVSKRSRT